VIGVPAVIDIEHGYGLGVVVDGVAHAVLAAPGSPVAVIRAAQRRADSSGFLGQWPADELKARPGDGLGEALVQLAVG
jgi:hypothetical protein